MRVACLYGIHANLPALEGGGEVVFGHATPRNDTELFVMTTADDKLLPTFPPTEQAMLERFATAEWT